MASVVFSKISGGVIDYTGDTLLYAFNAANPARLQTQSSYGTETVAYISDIPASFASFSSTATQTVTAANTVTPITYDTVELNTGGYTMSGANIRVSRAGNYEVIPSIQFDKSGGGVSTVEFWFQTSTDATTWTDVSRSATQCAISGTNGEVVGTVSLMLTLNALDYFRIVMASSDSTMSAAAFSAITTPYVRPAIPSIITSVKLLN
jgi:hypothetical protein